MKNRILLSLALTFLLFAAVTGQDKQRVAFDDAAISFIPEPFMSQRASGKGIFSVDAGRFGSDAQFLCAPAVKLETMNYKAANAFERKLATPKYHRELADKLIKGLSGGDYVELAFENAELLTVNGLPTAR